MPQFGLPNQLPSFPSWATPPIVRRIGRHPHPGTNRTDGRICWPSDELHRSLATRQYGRLLWSDQTPDLENPLYANWENVWWDWTASGASEAFAWIDTTSSGRKALLRLRWYAALPIMGLAGTEFYYECFVDDVSIGIRTIEMPDDTDAWQFDSSLPLVAPEAGLVTPPKADPVGPDQWFWIENNATSECWRWWGTELTTPCANEQDPNGMASLAVTMKNWDWGNNGLGVNGELTQKQREFAAKLNSRHICTPVFLKDIGKVDCNVQYQSPIMWDPKANPTFLETGAYYGYSLQVTFGPDRWRVYLHIRVWSVRVMTPTWEPWTSTALSSGILTLFGMNGRLMNAAEIIPGAPYASRSADQYGFQNTMFNTPAFGPFGLNDLGEGTCTVNELTANERGQEPPLEGPLDMPKAIRRAILRSTSTQNISTAVAIPWDDIVEDPHEYLDPAGSNTELVIPDGVNAVRITAQGETTIGKQLHQIGIRAVTGSLVLDPRVYIWQDWSGGESRSQVHIDYLPVVPGQKLDVFQGKFGESQSGNPERNFVQIESIEAQVEPFSATIVPGSQAIPAAGTDAWMLRIPPSLNNYTISNIGASLGETKSPTQAVLLHLNWIRKTGRTVVDITDDPVSIDADHWTSETSSSPYSIHPAGEPAFTGDILIASIAQSGIDATGLIVDIEFTEAP